MAEPVDSAYVRIAPFIHHSKEELQELDSVAAQAIFVHDHNLLDHAAQDAFQKGRRPLRLKLRPLPMSERILWLG